MAPITDYVRTELLGSEEAKALRVLEEDRLQGFILPHHWHHHGVEGVHLAGGEQFRGFEQGGLVQGKIHRYRRVIRT